MDQVELLRRIIDDADNFHFVGEEQWNRAIELEPTDEDSVFEFLRLVRTALRFYARAYLVLDMVETDDEQDLEDLLEIIGEQQEELSEFFRKNDVANVLSEEGSSDFSRIFAVGESVRALLLGRSNELAATLHHRFVEE